MAYDFTDGRVRALVGSTHIPEEVSAKVLADGTVELAMVCRQDKQPWPCAADKELAAFQASEQAVMAQGLRARAANNPSRRGGEA